MGHTYTGCNGCCLILITETAIKKQEQVNQEYQTACSINIRLIQSCSKLIELPLMTHVKLMKSYNVDIADAATETWESCPSILVNETSTVCSVGKAKLIISVRLHCSKSHWEGNPAWELNWSGSKWDVWIIPFPEDSTRGHSCICASRAYCTDQSRNYLWLSKLLSGMLPTLPITFCIFYARNKIIRSVLWVENFHGHPECRIPGKSPTSTDKTRLDVATSKRMLERASG